MYNLTVNFPFGLITFVAQKYIKFFPKSAFILVTGLVNRSTTIDALVSVLNQRFPISTITDINSVDDIDKKILKLKPNVKKVILEFLPQKVNEAEQIMHLIKPSIVILTKTQNDQVALNNLITQLPSETLLLANYDDIFSRKITENIKASVTFFGTDPDKCLVWAENFKIDDFSTTFEINYGVERVKANLKLLGIHNIYPAMAATTLALTLGLSLTSVKNALEKVEPQDHVLTALLGYNGSFVIDDTLKNTPFSVEAAIDTLMQIPARRHILVLGEIPNLGTDSENIHRKIARKIFKDKVDLVLLGLGDANFVVDELEKLGFISERVMANLQIPQMTSKLLKELRKGDVCLVKGDKISRLDEVVRRIATIKS